MFCDRSETRRLQPIERGKLDVVLLACRHLNSPPWTGSLRWAGTARPHMGGNPRASRNSCGRAPLLQGVGIDPLDRYADDIRIAREADLSHIARQVARNIPDQEPVLFVAGPHRHGVGIVPIRNVDHQAQGLPRHRRWMRSRTGEGIPRTPCRKNLFT